MSNRFLQQGSLPWSQTGVGTNAGVTVTRAAATGQVHVCLGIQASGDAAAIVTIESPAGTFLWRKRYAAAFQISEAFAPGAISGASGAALLVKVSASTSNSEANIQGVSVIA